jgi:hypothetical protein
MLNTSLINSNLSKNIAAYAARYQQTHLSSEDQAVTSKFRAQLDTLKLSNEYEYAKINAIMENSKGPQPATDEAVFSSQAAEDFFVELMSLNDTPTYMRERNIIRIIDINTYKDPKLSPNEYLQARDVDLTEALAKNWQALTSADSEFAQTHGTVGMNQADFQEYMHENTLSQTFDWRALIEELDDIQFYVGSIEKTGELIDYIASRYAQSYLQIVNDDNSSDEQKSVSLEVLDALFAYEVNGIADHYAESTLEWHPEYSIPEDTSVQELLQAERGKIRDSYTSVVFAQAQAYIEFAEGNENYANIAGTEYDWLQNDGTFMSAQLRAAYAASGEHKIVQNVPEELYSRTDMIGLAQLLREFNTTSHLISLREIVSFNILSDEEIGFRAGYMAIKADVIAKQPGMTGNMTDLFQQLVEKYLVNLIASQNKAVKDYNEQVLPFGTRAKELPADQTAARAIYDVIVDEYERTQDIGGALQKGAEAGKAAFMAKSANNNLIKASPQRYLNEIFWRHFDYRPVGTMPTVGSIKPAPWLDVVSSVTSAQLLNRDWDLFLRSLEGEEFTYSQRGSYDWKTINAYNKQLDIGYLTKNN